MEKESRRYTVTIDPIGLHNAENAFMITETTNLPGNPEHVVQIVCVHALTAKAVALPGSIRDGSASVPVRWKGAMSVP